MLQPPSPLLEMASLRLPDSDEFDVDTRRRSNNGNVPPTTVAAIPPATGTLLQMRNDLGSYLNNLIAEAITTNPRSTMEEHGGLLNASKTVNLSTAEQIPDRSSLQAQHGYVRGLLCRLCPRLRRRPHRQ